MDRLVDAVRSEQPRVLSLVHGETSTGIEQPLAGLAEVCRETDTLLVVDAVATLGGVDLDVDGLGIDLCYSGSQKCLSAPPGLAPITVSDRAMRVIRQRRTPVQSWYLDLELHAGLWGPEHIYHHTSPVLNLYALQEALQLVHEEELAARCQRHCVHATALRAGLEALGLELFGDPGHRMSPVTTVFAPPNVSALAVRRALIETCNLEIACGLGEYSDRMWRIGIMGHSAQRANVTLLLAALEQQLSRHGHEPPASAVAAADKVFDELTNPLG
jgi:alanine-glyoxylate transaminase / serine-glyoxylate transaminase / serine-pyruvate transaminase